MTERSVRPSHAGGPGSALGRMFARLIRPGVKPAAGGGVEDPERSTALTDRDAPPVTTVAATFDYPAAQAIERAGDSSGFRVAVIGAGLSGSLLAVHLLQHCRPADRVFLIESRAGFGRGLAYSTNNPNHLLNVRAGNMSAFPDRPDHFLSWLQRRARDADEPEPTADCFVSRQLYGAYIRSLLADRIWAGGKGRNLVLVPDTAQAITEDGRGFRVVVEVGRSYPADVVVLAAGHFPPGSTLGAYRGNPWDAEAVAKLHADDSVALIGTGLTMVDVVQSLLDAGHRGPIVAIPGAVCFLPSTRRPYRCRWPPRICRGQPRSPGLPAGSAGGWPSPRSRVPTGEASSMACGRTSPTFGAGYPSTSGAASCATCGPGGMSTGTGWPRRWRRSSTPPALAAS